MRERSTPSPKESTAVDAIATPAALPFSEPERLRALQMTRLLQQHDAPPACKALVRVAADLFRVPIVLITVLSKDKQQFVCSVGNTVQETHRDFSFCAHALVANRTMVVLNARLDPRFRTNPYVTGEAHVRFYAGTPIYSPDGHCIATLCVLDTRRRIAFGPAKRRLLEGMARIASALLQPPDELQAVVA